VAFEQWAPHLTGSVRVPSAGEEVFVVEGSFVDELGEHRAWSWSRNPMKEGEEEGQGLRYRKAGPEGCLLYVKSGHLLSPEVGVS